MYYTKLIEIKLSLATVVYKHVYEITFALV